MRKNLLMILGMAILSMGSGVSAANDVLTPPGPPGRFTYGKVVIVDKVVPCRILEWRMEKVPITVQKCCWEVRPAKTTVMVPKYYDDTKLVTDIIRIPHEQVAQRCRLTPIILYDNKTGCCTIGHKREFFDVKYMTEEIKLVNRTVSVKVCRMTPTEVAFEQKVCVYKPETVLTERRFPVYVTGQKTVRVPMCVPSDVPVPVGPPGFPPHIPGREQN